MAINSTCFLASFYYVNGFVRDFLCVTKEIRLVSVKKGGALCKEASEGFGCLF